MINSRAQHIYGCYERGDFAELRVQLDMLYRHERIDMEHDLTALLAIVRRMDGRRGKKPHYRPWRRERPRQKLKRFHRRAWFAEIHVLPYKKQQAQRIHYVYKPMRSLSRRWWKIEERKYRGVAS